jgi:prepilin-type N-terminal cleavage/methylation domain-containing protein
MDRRAFTLIEVLIALAIFLLAMAVFGSMIVRNGQVAAGIDQQNLATRLCQSQLHQVAVGIVPLTSQDDMPFDEEPNYTWSMQADNGPVDGLWRVTMTVKRQTAEGGDAVQCTLTQMVLDPSVVGSNEDVTPVISSTTSSSTSGSSSSSANATPSSAAAATSASPPAAAAAPSTKGK